MKQQLTDSSFRVGNDPSPAPAPSLPDIEGFEYNIKVFQSPLTGRWGYSVFVWPNKFHYDADQDSMLAATTEALAAVSRITGTKLELERRTN